MSVDTIDRKLKRIALNSQRRQPHDDGPTIAAALILVIQRLQADPNVNVNFSDLLTPEDMP